MKILSTSQVRAADAYTIENEPIKSLDLMERASRAFVEAYLALPVDHHAAITVVCGPGNNGGDGLAIARLLQQKNFEVEVCMVRLGASLSEDCAANLERWQEHGTLINISAADQLKELRLAPVVIDAIFGSGISRPVSGLASRVVDIINDSGSRVIAVDMPSGLFSDQPNGAGQIVKANYTLSFQNPKLAFFLPQNNLFVGEWKVLDIGLSQRFIDNAQSNWFSIDQALIKRFERKPATFAHKGNFGHALLVAGSQGKIGAAILEARAALRGGVGLLTVHIPGCGFYPLQTAVPEAMCQVDPHHELCTDIILSEKITCVGIGPGLGQQEATVKGFKKLLEQVDFPMVIDADALNLISQHRECLELIPSQSILTPHPKEFQRLAGTYTDDYHRLQIQSEFSRRYQVIIIFKGAHSTVSLPDGRLFFNTTGNPGMATAGSGDVLTGLVTGMLARNSDPELAAIVGTFIHGLAGDLAAAEISQPAMIAGDLIDYIGPVIKKTNLLL